NKPTPRIVETVEQTHSTQPLQAGRCGFLFAGLVQNGTAWDNRAGGRTRQSLLTTACAMKIGRNDPCPCGSGKKNKKCCLEKDLARKAAEPFQGQVSKHEMAEFSRPADAPMPTLQPLPPRPPPPPREPTPQDELWERFEIAGYEDKISLFVNALDE